MEGTIKLFVLVLLAILQLHYASSQDLKTIFDCVDTLDEGYEIAKREGRPIMLIVHRDSCGACKRLKPKLKDSKTLKTYSANFVVVNAVNGNDEKAAKLGPDYVPKILFFAPDGKPLRVTNRNNRQYEYYYETAEDLYTSMQQAQKLTAKSRTVTY